MGYPKIAKFDQTIIRRTKENLEIYSGPSEFTFLLSQCLALIILPIEFYKKGARLEYDFLNQKAGNNQKLIKIFNTSRNISIENEDGTTNHRKKAIFRTNQGIDKNLSDVYIYELFFKLRNSIAHWGITPVKSGDNWEGVILKNVNGHKVTTMDVYITQEELKQLCIYIADKWARCSL